ncbi:MAG: TMEM165/GDT1 family protein [Chloroflexi bacterium]|nr:TMEM165/GDT1 family protein [Chloroflexota bacterium]
MDLNLVVSTFVLVFVAELPDKTALASLMLATRLPPRQVVIGAWLAFLVQTGVAVLAGSLLQLLPEASVRIAAGLGFLVFAVLAWRRDVDDDAKVEKHDVLAGRGRYPPWLASFLVVFAAEWGDLTQLATAGLVARTGQPLEVGVGAVAALWTVTVLAATVGSQLGRLVRPTLLNRLSAVLFAAIGLVMIVSALGVQMPGR